ncbi:hypothetical protein [Streptomyces sp. CA2R106]|uniref:hypothetical protein n=1 Tax=Streptomyces sp. CA2R106 TaxID=3120153 RepID=UPI00300AD188
MQHHYIGPHRADSTGEFLELALGTPLDLWLGVPGESDTERAAREAAAADILADDPALYTGSIALLADTISTMPELLALAPAPRPAARPRRKTRRGAAA